MLKLDEIARLEEVIDRFEDAWQRGDRPEVDDYLTGDDGRHELMVELVHADLEYRLKAGEAARVEEYLRRYPELNRESEVVRELVKAEWRLRQREAPSLTAEEYERRFPGLCDELTGASTIAVPSACVYRDTPLIAGRDEATRPESSVGAIPLASSGGADTRSHYRILRLHARGGLGEILAARDEELHREVALKRLLRRPGQEAESRRRFLREAEITSQLEHPGVVPVYGLGQSRRRQSRLRHAFYSRRNLSGGGGCVFTGRPVRPRPPPSARWRFGNCWAAF